MKDWKERFEQQFVVGNNDRNFYLNTDNPLMIEDFIEQLISERDKEWEKWKVLAEAMDNAPVGHRVTIKHLLGEDEWTLTRRNK